MMSKVKYPDDIIRARRESIDVAKNLEILGDGDEFIIRLFDGNHLACEKLTDAFDEAASLILGDGPGDFVEFYQIEGVWRVDIVALHAEIHASRRHG